MRRVFSFPNPVNEKAARVVAAGVLALTVLTLATSAFWLTVVLAAGFALRVLTGPTLSPLGQIATRVIAPRLGPPKDVAGPPKRFAQAIGFVLTAAAGVLALGLGHAGAASALLVAVAVAAGLESFLAVCLGCTLFGALMRAGLIPLAVCAECGDLWSRPGMNRPGA